jgi:hypothetical protein
MEPDDRFKKTLESAYYRARTCDCGGTIVRTGIALRNTEVREKGTVAHLIIVGERVFGHVRDIEQPRSHESKDHCKKRRFYRNAYHHECEVLPDTK